ncbi:MAG: hypothetical protein Q4E76_02705 [Tissierellia bacterium]|nr:hypothetical protein [Tissierellia bacterium]
MERPKGEGLSWEEFDRQQERMMEAYEDYCATWEGALSLEEKLQDLEERQRTLEEEIALLQRILQSPFDVAPGEIYKTMDPMVDYGENLED